MSAPSSKLQKGKRRRIDKKRRRIAKREGGPKSGQSLRLNEANLHSFSLRLSLCNKLTTPLFYTAATCAPVTSITIRWYYSQLTTNLYRRHLEAPVKFVSFTDSPNCSLLNTQWLTAISTCSLFTRLSTLSPRRCDLPRDTTAAAILSLSLSSTCHLFYFYTTFKVRMMLQLVTKADENCLFALSSPLHPCYTFTLYRAREWKNRRQERERAKRPPYEQIICQSIERRFLCPGRRKSQQQQEEQHNK